MFAKKLAALLFAAFASAAFFGGCGSSIADICQKQCDCQGGCQGTELQRCISVGEAEQNRDEENGCGETFDELLSCASSAQCKGKDLDLRACDDLADEAEHCGKRGDTASGG